MPFPFLKRVCNGPFEIPKFHVWGVSPAVGFPLKKVDDFQQKNTKMYASLTGGVPFWGEGGWWKKMKKWNWIIFFGKLAEVLQVMFFSNIFQKYSGKLKIPAAWALGSVIGDC